MVDGVEVSVTTSKIVTDNDTKSEEMRFLRYVCMQSAYHAVLNMWHGLFNMLALNSSRSLLNSHSFLQMPDGLSPMLNAALCYCHLPCCLLKTWDKLLRMFIQVLSDDLLLGLWPYVSNSELTCISLAVTDSDSRKNNILLYNNFDMKQTIQSHLKKEK